MNTNIYSEIVYTEQDVCDALMHNPELDDYLTFLTETINTDSINELAGCTLVEPSTIRSESPQEFHRANQQQWHMPEEYKQLDVAKHILDKCKTDAELQRVGEELLLYMERDLFDLLRYLVYLVDTMRANGIIWGVGRGSSVASYVLYLIGIHRVDSMYYDLDVREFLR
jgi:hypothetical protein